MIGNDQEAMVDFTVDKDNLYREESITDMKAASIRKLVPIKADGTEDTERAAIFLGHTQLMSPDGPLPLQAPIEAATFEEAMDAFPEAMKGALEEMIERARKMQEMQQMQQHQEESRIIVPGRN